MTKLCSIPGCGKPAQRKRRVCTMHHKRWQRHRDYNFTSDGKRGLRLKWIIEHSSYADEQCLTWPFSRLSSGYPGTMEYLGKTTGAARIMCSLVNGPPPKPNLDAAHSCGKGHLGCINPKHLSWKTRKENAKDQITHNTKTQGEKHGMSKLTESQVREIRSKYATGSETFLSIARAFGVSQSLVHQIVSRTIWDHVP